jgi:hypothetical protein
MAADGSVAYGRRHKDQKSMSDADQAEALALRNGLAIVDEGIYDDLVAGAMDDFENEEDEAVHLEWHGRDLAEDNGAGAVLEFVEERRQTLRDLYPFEVVDNRIQHSGRSLGWYEFMLACSIQKDISSKPFNRMPQIFERASSVLSEGLLGPGAQSLHVGQPRDPAIQTFKAGYERLNELTGEWPWKPADGLPVAGPPSGDDGLDFVAWISAGANRGGHIFLVGQCACGDAWTGKLTELQLKTIGAWTAGGEGWAVDPIRLFTTSHVLAGGWFIKDQKASGLILDRLRLCLLEQSRGPGSLDPFREEMADLTKKALNL